MGAYKGVGSGTSLTHEIPPLPPIKVTASLVTSQGSGLWYLSFTCPRSSPGIGIPNLLVYFHGLCKVLSLRGLSCSGSLISQVLGVTFYYTILLVLYNVCSKWLWSNSNVTIVSSYFSYCTFIVCDTCYFSLHFYWNCFFLLLMLFPPGSSLSE